MFFPLEDGGGVDAGPPLGMRPLLFKPAPKPNQLLLDDAMVVTAPGVTGDPNAAIVDLERGRIGLVAAIADGDRHNRAASGQEQSWIGTNVAGARHVSHFAVHSEIEPTLEIAGTPCLGRLCDTDEVESLADGASVVNLLTDREYLSTLGYA